MLVSNEEERSERKATNIVGEIDGEERRRSETERDEARREKRRKGSDYTLSITTTRTHAVRVHEGGGEGDEKRHQK